MKETKRQERIEVMFLLYQHDLYQALKQKNQADQETSAYQIYQAITSELEAIDELIESNLFDYSLSRISYVDRAILRLATYELKNTNTPASIIIDEAIEITKTYSNLDDAKQHKFNNSVLDAINKSVRG